MPFMLEIGVNIGSSDTVSLSLLPTSCTYNNYGETDRQWLAAALRRHQSSTGFVSPTTFDVFHRCCFKTALPVYGRLFKPHLSGFVTTGWPLSWAGSVENRHSLCYVPLNNLYVYRALGNGPVGQQGPPVRGAS